MFADNEVIVPSAPIVIRRTDTTRPATLLAIGRVASALRDAGAMGVLRSGLARSLGMTNSCIQYYGRRLQAAGAIEVMDGRSGGYRWKAGAVSEVLLGSYLDPYCGSDAAPPPRRGARKRRPCIMCRNPMMSAGAGHRICDRCKSSELYRGAG